MGQTTIASGGTGVDADGDDDIDRLEALYREHHAPLVRVARLLIGDHARAEEVVHDAFLRLHPKLASVENPPGYLRITVVNLCRDHHRRLATARRHAEPPAPPVDGPDVPATATAVWQALQALPERQREALTLRFYGDLTTEDIARLLDARPATVRSLIHRVLATLKEVVPHD